MVEGVDLHATGTFATILVAVDTQEAGIGSFGNLSLRLSRIRGRLVPPFLLLTLFTSLEMTFSRMIPYTIT